MIEIKNKGKSNLFINGFFANGDALTLNIGESVQINQTDIANNFRKNKKKIENLKKYITITDIGSNILKPAKQPEPKPEPVVEEVVKQEEPPVEVVEEVKVEEPVVEEAPVVEDTAEQVAEDQLAELSAKVEEEAAEPKKTRRRKKTEE